MNTNMGLWIDHRRAVIVIAGDASGACRDIVSHADRQPGRKDGRRTGEAFESNQAAADDVQERRFQQALNVYYDEVISCVAGAKVLMIFGPGEAKSEFRKRLEKEKPGGRTVRLEAVDKMTDRQIVAKVRDYFENGHTATAV